MLHNWILLDYNYFKEHYKLIAVDLSKQQKLDANPRSKQQINFTGNIGNVTSMFFIIEEVKETILDFSKCNMILFRFNKIRI